MGLQNTTGGYGWIAITLHWLVAVAVFALFGLGLWMVELTYYDPWYREAPNVHKSVGILLLLTVCGRLLWRLSQPHPEPLGTPMTRVVASLVHNGLYALMIVLMLAGYLISTADGSAIAVFGLFEVPALISDLPNQEDVAGEVHEWLAWLLISVVVLHAGAALKHQLIDRDDTLARMIRPR
ncbi:MAG: cytochrome b [Halieaceae bacterium]|nr:cytochrome b [Halieaceae bacterium]